MRYPNYFGRVSLFIIYFWFGILKVIGISPAEGLVQSLFSETFGSFLDYNLFCLGFGIFECLLGLIWLFPKFTKAAFYILIAHMGMTFLPTLLLPEATWQMWFTPTLVGQYIIKNFALISLGWFIWKADTDEAKEAMTKKISSHVNMEKILVKKVS